MTTNTTNKINKMKYNMIHENDGDTLLKLINDITNNDTYDITNNDTYDKNKSILNYIYDIIANGTVIIRNKTENIKTLDTYYCFLVY
jgi:hypothetical protein